MKKILFLSVLFFIGLPILAACSITGGACSAPVNFEANSLKDRLIPNNLQQLKRTDYFQNQIGTPYGTNTHSKPPSLPEAGNFDSECEFGDCLPTQDNSEVLNSP